MKKTCIREIATVQNGLTTDLTILKVLLSFGFHASPIFR